MAVLSLLDATARARARASVPIARRAFALDFRRAFAPRASRRDAAATRARVSKCRGDSIRVRASRATRAMRRAVASSATTLARRAYRAEASPADRARALALSAPLGFVAGAFGACVGVGGGALIAPVVASAAKTVPQRVVSGTSLVAVVGTASASAGTFAREGLTDYAAAALLGGAATLSAPLGARMTARMDCAALRRTLAWFLAGAAPMVPLKAVALRARESGEGGKEKFDAAASAPTLVAVGATAGFASGLLGIGGGTLVTPLLALVSPLPQAAVLGTSLLAMLPPSVVALGTHYRMGNVDPRMGAALAVGTALGGAFGSSFAVDAPRGALEAVFFFGMLFLSNRTFRSLRK